MSELKVRGKMESSIWRVLFHISFVVGSGQSQWSLFPLPGNITLAMSQMASYLAHRALSEVVHYIGKTVPFGTHPL